MSSRSHWHKLYTAKVGAPPATLFALLADLPAYGTWLPPSSQYRGTTEVEPYPVRSGSRYHDGKPGEPGKSWRGEVTGYQPPGSIDFHHTIRVGRLRTTIDVHIHYSFEGEDGGEDEGEGEGEGEDEGEDGGERTRVTRWLVLDIEMPVAFRPLRPLIVRAFDRENVRTLAAVKEYAETHP